MKESVDLVKITLGVIKPKSTLWIYYIINSTAIELLLWEVLGES